MKLLTAAESRELDRLSQERYGIASYSLMTAAGEAVAKALVESHRYGLAQRVLAVAGKGNNGGDAIVAARQLTQEGAPVRVALLTRPESLKGDAARACKEYLEAGGAL